MSLPRYAEYKASGLDWLPSIPSHWEVCALKRVATLKSGDSITTEQINESGNYPVYGGNGLRGFTTAFTHEGRFALIGRQGALCGNVNYSQGKFWASEHAVVVTPIKPIETTWLGELLRAMNLNQYSVSAAQPGLSVELISNIGVPLAPQDEQAAIATFLDRETAKIDALIAEQEKLIALLAEKRQATISHAVTSGKTHWTRMAIKHALHGIIDTEHKTAPFYDDGQFLVVRTSNIKNGTLVWDDAKYTDQTSFEEWTRRGIPEPGDIIFTREAPAGEACIVPSGIPLCLGQRTVLMKTDGEKLHPQFALYSLYGGLASEFIANLSQGSTVAHFNMGDIGNIPLLLPPIEEQRAIAAHLDAKTAQLDALRDKAQRGITLLKERRSALITAAVTGQIDVRNLTPEISA